MQQIASSIPYQVHELNIHQEQVRLCIPVQEAVKESYTQTEIAQRKFPYWAKLWPSARAMGEWLIRHPQIYQSKTVHEIAAGLGLPGILAAKSAASVRISDYDPEAVTFMQANIAINPGGKIQARCINWQEPEAHQQTDVLLLSDINYAPSDYPALYQLFEVHLNQQTCIVLATPERLQGRQFLESIAAHCIHHEVLPIDQEPIHMLVYAKQPAASGILQNLSQIPPAHFTEA